MTNTNCLEGIKCPNCGNENRFLISSTIWADVTDEGSEIANNRGDFEWDGDSLTECPECSQQGKLADFQSSPEQQLRPAYTATQDTNGTEDELTIRNPEGEPMASITFWESDEGSRSRAHADCKLILEALNAFSLSKSAA